MSDAKSRLSRPVMILVSLIITVLAVWLAIRDLDMAQVWRALTGFPAWPFAVGLVIMVLVALARALRFHVITRAMSTSFVASLEMIIIGYFFTIVLPFRTGELVRIGYFSRRARVPVLSVVSATAVERAMDMTTLAFLSAVCLPSLVGQHLEKFPISPTVLAVAAGAGVVGAVVLGLLVRRQAKRAGEKGEAASGFARRLNEVLAGFSSLGSITNVLWGFLLSATVWLLVTLAIKIAFLASNVDIPFAHAGIVMLGTCFAIALPPTPASIGTYHAGFEYAAWLVGIPRDVSLPLAIVFHLLIQLPFLPVAGVILITGGRRVLARPPDEGDDQK